MIYPASSPFIGRHSTIHPSALEPGRNAHDISILTMFAVIDCNPVVTIVGEGVGGREGGIKGGRRERGPGGCNNLCYEFT